MKRFLLFNLALLFAVSLTLFFWTREEAIAEQKEKDAVSFRWAFGAIVGPVNDRRLVAITRDTTLKTGDKLKMLIELKQKCFVYLIYHSAQDEMHMLFPYKVQQFTLNYETLKKYYIPQNEKWFELDKDAGQEKFYLLASAQRLIGLEALLGKYKSAKAVKKRGLVKELLAEIRKIKKQHRRFTTTAERPVPIGGSVRGVIKDKTNRFPDIDPIAAEVSATNFYSRTFTIEHQ